MTRLTLLPWNGGQYDGKLDTRDELHVEKMRSCDDGSCSYYRFRCDVGDCDVQLQGGQEVEIVYSANTSSVGLYSTDDPDGDGAVANCQATVEKMDGDVAIIETDRFLDGSDPIIDVVAEATTKGL
jgi:hypothetical protein